MKNATKHTTLSGIVNNSKRLLLFIACALLLPAGYLFAQNTQLTTAQLHQFRLMKSTNKPHTIIKNNNTALVTPFAVQQADAISNPLSNIIQALVGPGITVSNIQTTLPATSNIYGSFTGGTPVVGIETGLIMTSGSVFNALGPNVSPSTSQDNALPGYLAIDTAGFDAAVISFDVTSTTSFLSFKYVFASEEYNEYVGSVFNDVFAFLISGPGIPAGTNIALIPGTTTPVAINNINLGLNSQYYTNNDSIQNADPNRFQTLEYDGLTKVLVTSAITVVPGATYTITLIIQDVSDAVYDSGVFLEGGSITSDSCAIALSAEKDDTGCNGNNNGSIDLTVVGATGIPTYAWTNSATTEDIENLPPGSYNVIVTDTKGCTATLASPVIIGVNTLLGSAGIISGPAKVCSNQSGFIYTVDPIANATSYEWTLPAGMTPTSGGLITATNTIDVTTDNTFSAGAIKVHGANSCGIGGDSPLFAVSKATNKPSTPTPISGLTGTVYGYCAGNIYVFTTTSSANAVTFNWTTTAGTIIDGQGTNTITIEISSPLTGCVLTVTASNCGGTSAARKLNIRSLLPPPALNGASTVCKNTNPVQTYTVSSVGNPSSYTWSSTSASVKFSDGGAPLNPLSTPNTSVIVDFTNVTTGVRNVRVTANNNCGNSSIRTKAIHVTNCVRKADSSVTETNGNNILVFPNPAHDMLNIYFVSSYVGYYSIRLVDITGRVVYSDVGSSVEGTNEYPCHLQTLAPGIYTLVIQQGETMLQAKIVKE